MSGLDLDYEYAKRIDKVTKLEERFMSYYGANSLTPVVGYEDFQGIKVVSGDSVVFISGRTLQRGIVYKIYSYPVWGGNYTGRVFLIWDVTGRRFFLKSPWEITKFTP